MLMLLQTQSQRQEQSQKQAITGGVTDSLFPLVEAWLQESSDHWNAFRRVRRSKTAVSKTYRSVLDFLLCEVVPEHRAACTSFYLGGGAPLRELISPAEVRALEARLLLFLAVAYAAFVQQRACSWSTAVEIVDEIVSAA